MDIAKKLEITPAAARRALRDMRSQGRVEYRPRTGSQPAQWRSKDLLYGELLRKRMEIVTGRKMG